ncbi:MAG: peptidoglycan DD-metalloendopeptidase family protein [Chloroflexota bacterium]
MSDTLNHSAPPRSPAPRKPASFTTPFNSAWEILNQLGLAEAAVRLGTHALLIALILFFAWGLRSFYLRAELVPGPSGGLAAAIANATPVGQVIELPAYTQPDNLPDSPAPVAAAPAGIQRKPFLHTDVPARGREAVTVYTVKPGDTLFGIAEQFAIRPETVLWSNQMTLGDNPHSLRPGQELNILPVDGAYYRWSAGDGLNGVANFFNVAPEAIVDYPGNGLSRDALGDWSKPNIAPGSWLVIPGGKREFVSWSAPVIPLDNPGVAKILGPGACESVQMGISGSGTFIWPADNHYLSGFDFAPQANHPGIDIDGNEGSPVYAADSGVVVYAGWNNWGYGNVVVINHGNGWQTLYAHLSAYYVSCGMSVFQGNSIAAMGSTGNSTGPHLHYEMMYNGVKVNPHDYMK